MDQYRGATFIYNVKNGDPEHRAAIQKVRQENPEFEERLLNDDLLKPRTYSIDIQAGALPHSMSTHAVNTRQHDSSSVLQKPREARPQARSRANSRTAADSANLTYHEKLLKEIKFSLDIPGHPIRQIIIQFQTLLLAQIKHFNDSLIELDKSLQLHDLKINNVVYKEDKERSRIEHKPMDESIEVSKADTSILLKNMMGSSSKVQECASIVAS